MRSNRNNLKVGKLIYLNAFYNNNSRLIGDLKNMDSNYLDNYQVS
jgi:hypothetical protein